MSGQPGKYGSRPWARSRSPLLALDPGVVLRRAGQVQFGAGDVILGVLLDPGVIQAGVVGDEIEHQPQAALCGAARAGGPARHRRPDAVMHRVAGDGETGTGDVLFAQVRQRLLEFPAPLRVAARDLLPRRAGLPDAQEPDPVEAHLGQAVQLGVGNVVQRGRPAQGLGQLRQPDARVDLIQRRIVGEWIVYVVYSHGKTTSTVQNGGLVRKLGAVRGTLIIAWRRRPRPQRAPTPMRASRLCQPEYYWLLRRPAQPC